MLRSSHRIGRTDDTTHICFNPLEKCIFHFFVWQKEFLKGTIGVEKRQQFCVLHQHLAVFPRFLIIRKRNAVVKRWICLTILKKNALTVKKRFPRKRTIIHVKLCHSSLLSKSVNRLTTLKEKIQNLISSKMLFFIFSLPIQSFVKYPLSLYLPELFYFFISILFADLSYKIQS